MGRILSFIYGVGSYLAFLATWLYLIGFVGNLIVPKSMDSGEQAPFSRALFIDALLLGLFFVQHSGMARLRFKKRWTKFVPPHAERSTYVLISSLLLALLFWQWRPMPAVVWSVENYLVRFTLQALFWIGWLTFFSSTFMIDHFDLFGLRRVYLHLRGLPYSPGGFRMVALYKLVRHPVQTGFLIAFWATPTMTVGHLIFAVAATGFILVAIRLEERDLVKTYGEAYRDYQEKVSMIIP